MTYIIESLCDQMWRVDNATYAQAQDFDRQISKEQPGIRLGIFTLH